MRPVDLSHCYGCGAENPKGFHLKKAYAGDRSRIEFDVLPEHSSYPGLMHGGVTCVLMDEAMYHAVARLGLEAVTTSLTVECMSPALVGQHLVCEAWVVERKAHRVRRHWSRRGAAPPSPTAEGRSKRSTWTDSCASIPPARTPRPAVHEPRCRPRPPFRHGRASAVKQLSRGPTFLGRGRRDRAQRPVRILTRSIS